MSQEEVKVAASDIKKRNVVQQSSHSHNVGSSSAAAAAHPSLSVNQHNNQQVQSQAILEKGNMDSDDSDFEEPPEQRAILTILSTLPGITATDSRSYRIEALRVHLENQLGDGPFVNAYRYMVNQTGDDDAPNDELEAIIGDPKKMKFVNLITQLIVCEDAYYETSNK